LLWPEQFLIVGQDLGCNSGYMQSTVKNVIKFFRLALNVMCNYSCASRYDVIRASRTYGAHSPILIMMSLSLWRQSSAVSVIYLFYNSQFSDVTI